LEKFVQDELDWGGLLERDERPLDVPEPNGLPERDGEDGTEKGERVSAWEDLGSRVEDPDTTAAIVAARAEMEAAYARGQRQARHQRINDIVAKDWKRPETPGERQVREIVQRNDVARFNKERSKSSGQPDPGQAGVEKGEIEAEL